MQIQSVSSELKWDAFCRSTQDCKIAAFLGLQKPFITSSTPDLFCDLLKLLFCNLFGPITFPNFAKYFCLATLRASCSSMRAISSITSHAICGWRCNSCNSVDALRPRWVIFSNLRAHILTDRGAGLVFLLMSGVKVNLSTSNVKVGSSARRITRSCTS